MMVSVNFAVVILVALFTSNSLEAVSNETKIELSNWIPTVTDKWPTSEGQNEIFYFYHGEALGGMAFGLNKKLLDGITLASGTLDFSFKYWINSKANRFESRISNNSNLVAQLEVITEWENAPDTFKNLTLNQLRNFEFFNLDQFTVAFKDVKVKYLEKLTLFQLEHSPIHGYKSNPADRHSSISLIKESGNSKTFLVQKSYASYLNLIDSLPADKDLCYQIPTYLRYSFDVYFTFENANSGIKLLNSYKVKFCINEYIAMRNLKNFQLTFSIPRTVEPKFQFELIRTEVTKDLLIRKPDSELTDISTGWFYYNSFYGFSVRAPLNKKVWACDVVGNCYPYSLAGCTDIEGKQESDLGDEFKKFLAKSPVFRIVVQNENDVGNYTFARGVDESAMEQFRELLIDEHMLKDSQVSQMESIFDPKSNASIGQKIKIPNVQFVNNRMELRIPLDKIDFRFHRLSFSAEISSGTFKLKNLSFFIGAKKAIDFVSNFSANLSRYHFSTDDLFNQTENVLSISEKFIEVVIESSGHSNASMEVVFEIRKAMEGHHFDLTACPHSFKRDLNGQCKLANIYRYVEQECDPKSFPGCSNIFDRPLPSSSVYVNPTNLRYIPFQIQSNQSSSYLKVILPEIQKHDDFCIQFTYKSQSGSLLVNSNTETNLTKSHEFPSTEQTNQEAENQKICASQLSANVSEVKAFYFRFAQSTIIDTDEYYVRDVKFVQL